MWLRVPGSGGIANKTCTVRLRRILRSAAWRKGVTLSQNGSAGGGRADQAAARELLVRAQRGLENHPSLRDMATFTLATGLRAANVTGLTWGNSGNPAYGTVFTISGLPSK